jgi:hypothetical protein
VAYGAFDETVCTAPLGPTIGIPASAVVRMAMEAAAATADPRAVVMRMTGLAWVGEGEAKRKLGVLKYMCKCIVRRAKCTCWVYALRTRQNLRSQ